MEDDDYQVGYTVGWLAGVEQARWNSFWQLTLSFCCGMLGCVILIGNDSTISMLLSVANAVLNVLIGVVAVTFIITTIILALFKEKNNGSSD